MRRTQIRRIDPTADDPLEVDDTGTVQRLKLDENYTYPVPGWH